MLPWVLLVLVLGPYPLQVARLAVVLQVQGLRVVVVVVRVARRSSQS